MPAGRITHLNLLLGLPSAYSLLLVETIVSIHPHVIAIRQNPIESVSCSIRQSKSETVSRKEMAVL